MTYAVRVENEYVGLMGRHVVEGQMIVPGIPLIDIMTPEGVVETILSEGWGVVAHVEGGRIFPKGSANTNEARAEDDDEDDDDEGESGTARASSGGSGAVFPRGSVICHIVARMDRNQKGAGLRPRPGPSVRLRRELGVSPR